MRMVGTTKAGVDGFARTAASIESVGLALMPAGGGTGMTAAAADAILG